MWEKFIFPALVAVTNVVVQKDGDSHHLGRIFTPPPFFPTEPTAYTLPAWVTTTLSPPTTTTSRGSVIPDKDKVWEAQKYCDKVEDQLDQEMQKCIGIISLQDLSGLTNLLNCVNGILRLEEAACGCVKAGMLFYSFTWDDSDPHAICSGMYLIFQLNF